MDTRFAITEYPDAAVLTAELDALIKKPIYSINHQSTVLLSKSMKKNTLRRSVQSQRK